MSSGYTMPITQTADPVQLDQVLDALNTDTRQNLQDFLIGFGNGLTRKPSPAENAEQEPEVRGLNGAQALNRSYQRGPASLRGDGGASTRRSAAPKRTTSRNWSRAIGKVTAALNVHEQQLGELIVNFNAFFRAFATEATALRATVAVLPSSLTAITRGFTALDARLPADPGLLHRDPAGAEAHQLDGLRRAAVDRTDAGLAGARASSAGLPRD